MFVFFFKQKTAYEMRISDWSSDVCSSDLLLEVARQAVDEQAFPRVGGAHMRRQRLRPVEPQRLAQMGEGARHRDLVVAAPLGEVDDADRQIGRASCRGRVCQCV